MDVDVHACLASGFPDVDADVVAVGPMFVLKKPLCLIQKAKNSRLLLGCHFKKACDMAPWNDKDVSATQRVVVVAHVRKLALQYDLNGST